MHGHMNVTENTMQHAHMGKVYFFVFGFQPLITNLTVPVAQDAPTLPTCLRGTDRESFTFKYLFKSGNVRTTLYGGAFTYQLLQYVRRFITRFPQNCEKRLLDSMRVHLTSVRMEQLGRTQVYIYLIIPPQ